MGKITVIGSLNIDLVVRTERMPKAGETIAGSEFHFIPGGKGANQAVAASKAGALTQMIGCVGGDTFGSYLKKSLTESAVDITGIQEIQNLPTGTASIILDKSGQNRIIIIAGANNCVTPEFIERQWPKISQSSFILLQHEIPQITNFYIINRAHKENIKILLNPAPVYQIPKDILVKVNYLVLNETEASGLTGLTIDNNDDALKAAKLLHDYGIETVIITLGSSGSILMKNNKHYFQNAYHVKAIDTTAAGDTFVGSFAAKIINNSSPSEALDFASAASALAATKIGAQTSIPTWKEIKRFIKRKELNQE